ncbi:MAG: hypothetical protein KIT79_14195 [Deltaproteobacteria bacterium]|nr:hypothetical protein [Deltaproteobacteria bacterium]
MPGWGGDISKRSVWAAALVLSLFVLTATPALADWQYFDEHGKRHQVRHREDIPARYRGQAIDLRSEESRHLEQVELEAAPADALPVPSPEIRVEMSKPDAGPAIRPAFGFTLPRLPTSLELKSLDVAAKMPEFSWNLLSVRHDVGSGKWTLGTILFGLVVGVIAFILIDRFQKADLMIKLTVVFVAAALIVANTVISGYASRLDSAVGLFLESRKARGGTVSFSSVTGLDARRAGLSAGAPVSGDLAGNGSAAETGSFPGEPVGGDAPGWRQHAEPEMDFREIKKTLEAEMKRAQQVREQAATGIE